MVTRVGGIRRSPIFLITTSVRVGDAATISKPVYNRLRIGLKYHYWFMYFFIGYKGQGYNFSGLC